MENGPGKLIRKEIYWSLLFYKTFSRPTVFLNRNKWDYTTETYYNHTRVTTAKEKWYWHLCNTDLLHQETDFTVFQKKNQTKTLSVNSCKNHLKNPNQPNKPQSKETTKTLGNDLPVFFSVGINRYPVCDRWWWYMWTSHAGQLLGTFSRWPRSCCHSVGEWPRIGLHSPCRETSIKGTQCHPQRRYALRQL